MVEWIYICLKKTDGCLHGQDNNRRMVGWIDKWMTGWREKNRWMDEKIAGWQDEQEKIK